MREGLLIKCLAYLAILIVLAFFLFPIYWIFRLSITPQALVYEYPPRPFFTPTTKHFEDILLSRPFLFSRAYASYFMNSLIVSLTSMAIALVVGTLAAYSLARFKFKGSRSISFYILSALFAPPAAYVIPLFLMMRSVGLLDNQLGLALVYLTFNIPFTTWLMRGIIKDIPVEIEEAAMVDGCSRIGVLRRITFPLVKTGLAAAAIFNVVQSWNEYIFASVLTSVNSATLPVTMAAFASSGVKPVYWGYVAASAVLIMLPMIIFAFFVQKHIVRGFALGAVKG
jgi:multiple sugar transport system permease protein